MLCSDFTQRYRMVWEIASLKYYSGSEAGIFCSILMSHAFSSEQGLKFLFKGFHRIHTTTLMMQCEILDKYEHRSDHRKIIMVLFIKTPSETMISHGGQNELMFNLGHSWLHNFHHARGVHVQAQGAYQYELLLEDHMSGRTTIL